jgi:hypothetical protein
MPSRRGGSNGAGVPRPMSIEQAFLIRRARVSSCLAEEIQWIQSRNGRDSDHNTPNEPEISACARDQLEACLEQERI